MWFMIPVNGNRREGGRHEKNMEVLKFITALSSGYLLCYVSGTIWQNVSKAKGREEICINVLMRENMQMMYRMVYLNCKDLQDCRFLIAYIHWQEFLAKKK